MQCATPTHGQLACGQGQRLRTSAPGSPDSGGTSTLHRCQADHGVLGLHAGSAAGTDGAEGRLLGGPRRGILARAVRRP